MAKYAWYFFDPSRRTFYINYEPAAEYLKNLLEFYNQEKLPVTIIGYSQGGYLAPKLAEIYSPVTRVVGLACVFRHGKFKFREGVSYDQIHGDKDDMVNYSGAIEEFEMLSKLGNSGKFLTLPGEGHLLNTKYVNKTLELLS